MNFFQEPPPRAPLAIPASLPIPNFKEWRQSMSKDQKVRLAWCAGHFAVAVLVYNCDVPFTALSALAHLLLYDAMGATLCAAVEVVGNFDVWKQSSIHHPFGLERIEVLAGFALSVSLIFMGGDIMSHVVQDMVQSIYDPGHHSHEHGKPVHSHGAGIVDVHDSLSWASLVFRVMLGVLATVVSAVGLDNHSRISRTMHRDESAISWMPSILSNPSHFMTLTFSIAILLFPLLGASGYVFVDALLTPVIAGSMCYIGWLHAKGLAGMLVMSYPGTDHITEIDAEIHKDPLVSSVSDISLWQVHHELWLASMKIVMTGTDTDERALRERASFIVREIMGEDHLTRWETTIDITRTTLE
jgi:divalent metal cation (Fe/Co/Zn/Cd) transporter